MNRILVIVCAPARLGPRGVRIVAGSIDEDRSAAEAFLRQINAGFDRADAARLEANLAALAAEQAGS